MKDNETAMKINDLEKKFEKFMEMFKDLPITLALIQKDISLNAGLAKKVEENTSEIIKLQTWKNGIVMVIAVLSFSFGYFINLVSTNLNLQMEKTAREVVVMELSKYNIENND